MRRSILDSTRTMRAALAALCVAAGCGGDTADPGGSKDEIAHIGVLLYLSGASDAGYKRPLEWAVANVNAAGGAGGKKLKLEYVDLSAVTDIKKAAQDLIGDKRIVAVIGPDTSAGAFEIAPLFIAGKKPMISPAATSSELFRAFQGQKYIWRTVESDIAQVKMLLLLAARRGAQKVALLTSYDTYGTTFFDWFGFFATELGLTITNVVRDEQTLETCEAAASRVMEGAPDAIIYVPNNPDGQNCVAGAIRNRRPETHLLLSDSGKYPSMIEGLGELAGGIEGTSLEADPRSGFATAFTVIHGERPAQYAANVYDAVALVAYGLAYAGGKGGEALATGMIAAASGRGPSWGWDEQGIRDTLAAIRRGEAPDIVGGTGALDFDAEFYTELISSTYGYWRVEAGAFVDVEYMNTGDEEHVGNTKSSGSIFRTLATAARAQNLAGGNYDPGPRTGLWAVIASLSGGWSNYRHQADALAQYQVLKDNGVPDDRIILILEDDLAQDPANREPGAVRNAPGGPNLRAGAQIDYTLSAITGEDILNILGGIETVAAPVVVQSGPGDNVYVFLIGHGGREGVYAGINEATDTVGGRGALINAAKLRNTIAHMANAKRYRRLFIAIEACHGGVLGTKLDLPGVMLLAGANPFENSLAANYDAELDAWLSDQFAFEYYRQVRDSPGKTINELYTDTYLKVSGSHVSAYNSTGFGNANEIRLEEFLNP